MLLRSWILNIYVCVCFLFCFVCIRFFLNLFARFFLCAHLPNIERFSGQSANNFNEFNWWQIWSERVHERTHFSRKPFFLRWLSSYEQKTWRHKWRVLFSWSSVNFSFSSVRIGIFSPILHRTMFMSSRRKMLNLTLCCAKWFKNKSHYIHHVERERNNTKHIWREFHKKDGIKFKWQTFFVKSLSSCWFWAESHLSAAFDKIDSVSFGFILCKSNDTL